MKQERPSHKYVIVMVNDGKETVIEEVANVESAKQVLRDVVREFRPGFVYKKKYDGKHTRRIPMPDGNDIMLDIRRVY